MALNNTQNIKLHYLMLKYLYDTQTVSSSCFSHVWEDFKTKNAGITISAEKLKILFWQQIIPNIEEYHQLTDDQKIYFGQDNNFLDFDDETLGQSIICNETNSRRSYMLCQTTFEHLKTAESFEAVQNSFRKPNKCQGVFGFESDEDSDEDCVRIKQSKPPVIEEVDAIEGNLDAAFNAFLRLSNEKILTPAEVQRRIKDKNVLTSLDDIQKLPTGVRLFIQQMQFFKSTIVPQSYADSESDGNLSSEKENENSLDVPEGSTPTSSPRRSRRSSNVLKNRDALATSTPTSALNKTPKKAPLKSLQTATQKNVGRNKRMEHWTDDFVPKRLCARRSLSASPPTDESTTSKL